jgi:hypothetical protein
VNTGSIALVFDEPVRATTFNSSYLGLLSSVTVTTSIITLSSDDEVTDINGRLLTVILSHYTLDRIKLVPELAYGDSSVYLSFEDGMVADMNDNRIATLPSHSALVASVKIPDTTRPYLMSFRVDAQDNYLHLTFSEAMLVNSLNVKGLTIQDQRTAFLSPNATRPDFQYRLTSGYSTGSNGSSISIKLLSVDLNRLKRLVSCFRGVYNTFLLIDNFTITDMAGNAVLSRDDGNALQCETNGFVEDVTRPTLTSFSMHMGTFGPPLSLRLRFSETMNITSTDVTKLSLQDHSNQADGKPYGQGFVYLTGGDVQPLSIED